MLHNNISDFFDFITDVNNELHIDDTYCVNFCSLTLKNKNTPFSNYLFSPSKTLSIHLNHKEFQKVPRTYHTHDYYEIIYVFSGELINHIEKDCFICNKGDLTFINCNVRHYEEYSTDFSCLYLCLSKRFISDLLNNPSIRHSQSYIINFLHSNFSEKQISFKEFMLLKPTHSSLGTKHSEYSEQYLNQLIIELALQKPGYQFFASGIIYRFLSSFNSKRSYEVIRKNFVSSKQEKLFEVITSQIQKHKGVISREELSQLVSYNPDYLNHLIKEHTGMSFSHYCNFIRLNESLILLRESNLSINQIIQELGFSNKTYFYKLFTSRFHVTPQEYRDFYYSN